MSLLGVFNLSPLLQLGAFVTLAGIGWLLGFAALRILERRYRVNQRLLPVAPTTATVTTVFALFLGFLASDIWEEKRRATDAAYTERSSLEQILYLSGPASLGEPAVHDAALVYLRAVVDDEWGMGRNKRRSAATDEAFEALRAEVTTVASGDAPPALVAQLFRDLDAVSNARDTRLAIGSGQGASNAWFTVVVLYLLSFVAIAVVHLDRPPGALLAMTVFAVATCLALWFLAMHDAPYGGGVSLPSSMLGLEPPG